MRKPIIIGLAALAAVPAAAQASGGIPLQQCPSPAVQRPDAAQALGRLVNNLRRSHGLRRVRVTSRLSSVAANRSMAQVNQGEMAHALRGGRLAWAPVNRWAGENLALAPDAPAALNAMLGSPSHRQVMLSSRWRTMGIGAVSTCSGLLFTIDFLR